MHHNRSQLEHLQTDTCGTYGDAVSRRGLYRVQNTRKPFSPQYGKGDRRLADRSRPGQERPVVDNRANSLRIPFRSRTVRTRQRAFLLRCGIQIKPAELSHAGSIVQYFAEHTTNTFRFIFFDYLCRLLRTCVHVRTTHAARWKPLTTKR